MSISYEMYKKISKYYLREARSCLESKAYRMAILSAATSAHIALYTTLLGSKEYQQNDKVDTFSNVLKKIKEIGKWQPIEDDIEWLMNARNAVAHPEEWITSKTETDSSGLPTCTIEVKINPPANKKKIHTAIMFDNLEKLSEFAEDAIKKTEKIIIRLGFPVERNTVSEIEAYMKKFMQW